MNTYIDSPIITPSAYPTHYRNSCEDAQREWFLDVDRLLELFEFPESSNIQLRAYTQPVPNSVKVKFEFDNYWHNVRFYGESKRYCNISSKGTVAAIKRLIGQRKIFYIVLYYWE